MYPSSSSSILLLIIATILISTTSSIEAATFTWGTGAVSDNLVYRVCSTSTENYCYVGFFGVYKYTCTSTADLTQIEMWNCANNTCEHSSCTNIVNYTANVSIPSALDGNRELKWEGHFFSNAGGVISESTYMTSLATPGNPVICNDSFVTSRNFFVNSTDTCLPWVPHIRGASQRRYCNTVDGAVHAQYLNSGDCVNGTNPVESTLFGGALKQVALTKLESGACSEDGDMKTTCYSSPATIAVFIRSGAGSICSAGIMIVIVLVVVLFIV